MDLTGKKVAIFGLGVSGKAALNFVMKQEVECVYLVNKGNPDQWGRDYCKRDRVEVVGEDEARPVLAACDLIILSPGIARTHDALKEAHAKQVPVWNEVELAFRYFKGQIIAVTGTNGKTTTVSFMGELLKSSGYKTFVGGNIGTPFVCALDDNKSYDIAVLELSSFQCESLDQFRANYNLLLNIFENHGERYETVESYREAKWQMVNNCTEEDHIIYGPTMLPKPQAVQGQHHKVIDDNWDELFKARFDWEKMSIVGAHNRYNMYGCWLLWQRMGKDASSFAQALINFRGVEHRVEKLSCRAHVFNDAKSTNHMALETALEAVGERYSSIVLIMGGQKRHAHDIPSHKTLAVINKYCRKVLCIGDAAQDLVAIDSHMFININKLSQAKEYISEGDTVLFSPGYPSFDQYRNYSERGLEFKSIFEE